MLKYGKKICTGSGDFKCKIQTLYEAFLCCKSFSFGKASIEEPVENLRKEI